MSGFIVVLSLIFSIFLVPALSVADPLDNWHWRNPLPQGNNLYGITYGNNIFVAVGAEGTIMASQDGTTWSVKHTGTTAQLYALTFGNDTFVVVGSDGTMLTSQDGLAWSASDSGVTDDLKGITYGNDTFVAVGSGSTILTSTDAVTWEKRDSGVAGTFTATAYGNSMFMVVGGRNKTVTTSSLFEDQMDVVLTSPDGISWTEKDPGAWKGLRGLAFGNNIFAAVGRINMGDWENGVIVTSPDGVTWTERASGMYGPNGIVYGGQSFVAVGSLYNYMSVDSYKGMISTSSDGITWSLADPKIKGDLRAVSYGNNVFVAVGLNGLLLSSSDARDWTKIDSGSNLLLSGIVHGKDVFVAFGADYTDDSFGKITVLSSSTGILWTKSYLDTKSILTAAVYGKNKFVAVGHNYRSNGAGNIFTSTDGFEWTKQVDDFPGYFESIAYGNNTFVAVGHKDFGDKSVVLVSSTGEEWKSVKMEANGYLIGIAFGNGIFVAVGWKGTILTSSNGTKWTKRNIDTNIDFENIVFGNNIFAAVEMNYGNKILTSSDGIKWTEVVDNYDFFTVFGFANGIFFGSGGKYVQNVGKAKLYTSIDCANWHERDYLPAYSGATFGNGTFVVAGGDNILQSDTYSSVKISVSRRGHGTITSSDGKISCGSRCSETYEANAIVSLSATPVSGYIFSGWSGGGCTGTGTCNVTMDSNKYVVANFKIPAKYALKVKVINSKNGTVISSDGGITCGSGKNDCVQKPYYEGSNTSITLTATPNPGYIFKGWSGGGCSGTGTCSLIMSGNKTVTAKFGKI